MHDAFMLIGIRTSLTDSQVFQVTSHIVGLVLFCVHWETNSLVVNAPKTYSVLYENSL